MSSTTRSRTRRRIRRLCVQPRRGLLARSVLANLARESGVGLVEYLEGLEGKELIRLATRGVEVDEDDEMKKARELAYKYLRIRGLV